MKSLLTITSIVTLLLVATSSVTGQTAKYGQWDFVGVSGVSSMHGILEPGTNKVVFIERVELATQVQINGRDTYSTEYDFDTNQIRPLTTLSNTFCSAGSYLPNGTMLNLGGAEAVLAVGQGFNRIRILNGCNDGKCDWQENGINLETNRWYPTVEQLADGSIFILGGSSKGVSVNDAQSNVPSFETFPPLPQGIVQFPFLVETLPNNLYPSAHLLPDKNLFIMANTKALILDTTTWQIKVRLPDLPGPSRHYPLTGGSLLLPIDLTKNNAPEILVCGGSTALSVNATGEKSCGRISPLGPNPTWQMENMPFGRCMPDLVTMADGTILILNGINKGTAGFGKGEDPTLTPVLYNPSAAPGSRFSALQPSYIPRMYHSIAFTVTSGEVMVSGSNPNKNPTGAGPFPTEFRVELFTPPFLFTGNPRPVISQAPGNIKYGQQFDVSVTTYSSSPQLKANILNSGFVTHSTHMSQRQVWLVSTAGNGKITLTAPADGGTAPPGPYMLFVLDNGIPSKSVWVMLSA